MFLYIINYREILLSYVDIHIELCAEINRFNDWYCNRPTRFMIGSI